MLAVRVREFLRALFGSRYIAQLETDLIAMRQEREYFKGRAERLEMILLGRPMRAVPMLEERPRDMAPEKRRRTLDELQKELTERELAEEAARRKQSGVSN